jgi:ABC-type phosphate transport system substrate-binding protein
MKSLFARGMVPACVISVAAVTALLVPGAASAALGTQCSGTGALPGPPQEAAGSSLQAVAQQKVWTVKFNTSGAKDACNGKQGSKAKPVVSYISTSSGKGFEAWDPKEEFSKFGFIGTDNTVNLSEKEALEKEAKGPGSFTAGSGILTIPVAQSAVAIIVNLPEECTATSTVGAASGRLVLGQATLEHIYAGSVTKWNELAEGGKNVLTGTGCSSAIKPVVRKDKSGTTHILKRFLNWQTGATKLKFHGGSELTWNEASELGNSILWPEAITPVEGEKSSGVIAAVNANKGSIGYVALPEVREQGGFAEGSGGGKGTAKFWVVLENSNKKGKATFADPATNGDISTPGNSNCSKTVYTNGKASFPPPSVTANWNEVTTEKTSKTYALCGLTYELALSNYGAFELNGASKGEATTVANFLAYVTEKDGGQKEIAGHDYLALPKAVMSRAASGVKLINWEP